MDFRKILADIPVAFSPRKSRIGRPLIYVESHSAVVVCVSVSAV